MKKKILLIIIMFIFMSNVKALTFNVNISKIEDKGNNGTIGSIERIDLENKEIDTLFQDIGSEVSFSLTISNTGDRAGTLKSIDVSSTNDKIEYTSNLPDGGLAINGNDTNEVIITAKVKAGAVNGKSSSEVKITYNYDEGSCPDGEILSEDESMCLCPEGLERNEKGVCIKPEKKVNCEKDEIYNEAKKICEKKEVIPVTPDKNPINPSNPKTLDNIILITLLFIVSGLGIYAVMFTKLRTKKKKIIVGVLAGIFTLSLSFIVLSNVFGLDNLLSAIVNPITKTKELVVNVNEEIDLIETWDGECSLDVSELTPENIFEEGSGTESDPYKIKTAEQLSCFAKSVNNGETYEGKFIKQIKNIKLNNDVINSYEADNTTSLNEWVRIGYYNYYYDTNLNVGVTEDKYFSGTYDGNNHMISGLYFNNTDKNYIGLFGNVKNADISNLEVVDALVYSTKDYSSILCARAAGGTSIHNVKTFGKLTGGSYVNGFVSYYSGNLVVTDSENYADVTGGYISTGITGYAAKNTSLIMNNVTNYGNILTSSSGSSGLVYGGNVELTSCFNKGDIVAVEGTNTSQSGGLVAYGKDVVISDSGNEGNIIKGEGANATGGLVGQGTATITNSYNSGNITFKMNGSTNVAGLVGYGAISITNSYNTGDIKGEDPENFPETEHRVAGIVGETGESIYLENVFNTGDISATGAVGGIYGQANNGSISKAYNSGTINGTANYIGGIGGRSYNMVAENVYNTGSIIGTGYGFSTGLGGLFGEVNNLTNSYNTGNIIIDNYQYVGGLVGYSGAVITNSYNSGIITLKDRTQDQSIWIGGISSNATQINNTYNLGNIDITYPINKLINYGSNQITVGGIQGGQNIVNNNVNTGNITISATGDITEDAQNNVWIGGIIGMSGSESVSNNFNSGKIILDNKFLSNHFASKLSYGEIIGAGTPISSGNLFTHNDEVVANGYTRLYPELDDSSYGVYTSNNAPDILSTINGDNAFEIKEGDTLPTLKVFNN